MPRRRDTCHNDDRALGELSEWVLARVMARVEHRDYPRPAVMPSWTTRSSIVRGCGKRSRLDSAVRNGGNSGRNAGAASWYTRSSPSSPRRRCSPRSIHSYAGVSAAIALDPTTCWPCAASHRPRGPDDLGTEVVAVALVRRAGVQSHAHPQRADSRPFGFVQRALCRARRRDRGVGVVEHRHDRVAAVLHDTSAGVGNGITQQCVVLGERVRHRLRVRFPQRRMALDVGEEKGRGRARRCSDGPRTAHPRRLPPDELDRACVGHRARGLTRSR